MGYIYPEEIMRNFPTKKLSECAVKNRSVFLNYGSDVGYVTVFPYSVSENGTRFRVPQNILPLLEDLYNNIQPKYSDWSDVFRTKVRLLKNDVASFSRVGRKGFIESLFYPLVSKFEPKDVEYVLLRTSGVGFRYVGTADKFDVKMGFHHLCDDRVSVDKIHNNFYNWKGY